MDVILDGLPGIWYGSLDVSAIVGDFQVTGNPNLQNLVFPNLEYVLGSVLIVCNPVLGVNPLALVCALLEDSGAASVDCFEEVWESVPVQSILGRIGPNSPSLLTLQTSASV